MNTDFRKTTYIMAAICTEDRVREGFRFIEVE